MAQSLKKRVSKAGALKCLRNRKNQLKFVKRMASNNAVLQQLKNQN